MKPHITILLLILATFCILGSEAAEIVSTTEWPAAAVVLSCDFENPTDINRDQWPDRWTRRRGRGYPEYVKVQIVDDPDAPRARRVLEMQLNGGGAAISTPITPISPQYSFVATASVQTRGLARDVAFISLSLLDADGQLLETHKSPELSGDTTWQRVQIGPIAPATNRAVKAVLTLHLIPSELREDLTGSAWFDDVTLIRLPRMTLHPTTTAGLFTQPRDAEVQCDVSGIDDPRPELVFELMDHEGKVLSTSSQTLNLGAQWPGISATKPLASETSLTTTSGKQLEGLAGSTRFRPMVTDVGFYSVRVQLRSRGVTLLTERTSFVVLRETTFASDGQFGWSLPDADTQLSMNDLATLLSHSGLHWAKFPVWGETAKSERIDRVSWFAERLSIQNIDLIGVLDQPPKELREVFREKGPLPVASVFIEPELWHPVVDPVMTRLSLKVRYWQLGSDSDTSFVGFPEAATKLTEIKEHLQRFGQEVKLGVCWKWMNEVPPAATPPWSFLSYGGEPSLTPAEIEAYLKIPPRTAQEEAQQKFARWVQLRPLPKSDYPMQTRACDLVWRMLATRIGGAEMAFVPEPFDDQCGLLHRDATPTELYLPWRTTSSAISGAEYLGSLTLPGGSENHVFSRDGEAVMMIWNHTPTTELIELGENLRQIDLWGREIKLERQSVDGRDQHQVLVGPVPTFVTGIVDPIARWQIGLSFTSPRVASTFGREQTIEFTVKNPFPRGVGGEVTLIPPASWETDPRAKRFKLASDDQLSEKMTIALKPDASSGDQPLALEFLLTVDKVYKFRVYRSLSLGLADVKLELSTRLRSDGMLVVEQHMTNLSEKSVNFECTLFPPGRRREIRQVIDQAPGRSTLTFLLPDGKDLVGKTLWLRAEEIGGDRILNSTTTAEP